MTYNHLYDIKSTREAQELLILIDIARITLYLNTKAQSGKCPEQIDTLWPEQHYKNMR